MFITVMGLAAIVTLICYACIVVGGRYEKGNHKYDD